MTEDDSQSSMGDGPVTTPFADLYNRAVELLVDVPVDEKWINTAGRRTHLLTAGDPSNPPVVVFQGGNITNPVTLAWVQTLADEYYLIAPDTPGQPGMTTTETPPEYGPWVVSVLDELKLDTTMMIGASHGAGVLLETAAHAPDRIETATLVVPAGFGTPFSLDLARIVVPSLVYKVFPRRWILHRALAPMFTQQVSDIDAVIIETIGKALQTGDLTAEFPGPDNPEELTGFRAPTQIITAELDPFFPGEWACDRATQDLPSLDECILLTDERHFLSPAGKACATDCIRAFLAKHTDK